MPEERIQSTRKAHISNIRLQKGLVKARVALRKVMAYRKSLRQLYRYNNRAGMWPINNNAEDKVIGEALCSQKTGVNRQMTMFEEKICIRQK